MSFLQIINKKKITLISIFLFLSQEKKLLKKKINLIEKKNNMLTDDIDLDYLETVYREKFMVGKKGEKVFVE